MARTYKLDHFTKGTGASVAPLDDASEAPPKEEVRRVPLPRERRGAAAPTRAERLASPLPPGHVRKKATGEIGRVRAVDARAGTAEVQWLHDGRTSTVPLASVSRR